MNQNLKFSVAFDDSDRDRQANSPALGLLVLNGSKEWFRSSLSFWNESQYQEHWQHAVQLLLDGQEKSALITDLTNLQYANFLTWWPMWSLQGQIHIQNHLLFLHELSSPFDLSRFYEFVGQRETRSDDSIPISEWIVDLDDLKAFVLLTR